MSVDPFDDFNLESRIADRGRQAGLELRPDSIRVMAAHARAVLEHNVRLKLTTITEPEEFLERHIGESIEGAALLDPKSKGRFVDLGSGTGYPAIPLAAVHRDLDPVCVEANEGKARFLENVLSTGLGRGSVWARQVQRPRDLDDVQPIHVLSSRAMGNWERIVPRVARAIAPGGVVLLWAGEAVKEIATRDAWKRLTLTARHALPGRQRSWIWCFRAID